MSKDAFELNTKNLDLLVKLFTENQSVVEVGILGTGTNRTDAATNAEIGAKHEFGDPTGTPPLPVRSFLRMPLVDELQNYLIKEQAFTPTVAGEIVKTRTVVPWLRLVGFTCEQVIFDAFNSGGFGKWKPSNMALKKNHQTLVETQQLRNSITSRVKE